MRTFYCSHGLKWLLTSSSTRLWLKQCVFIERIAPWEKCKTYANRNSFTQRVHKYRQLVILSLPDPQQLYKKREYWNKFIWLKYTNYWKQNIVMFLVSFDSSPLGPLKSSSKQQDEDSSLFRDSSWWDERFLPGQTGVQMIQLTPDVAAGLQPKQRSSCVRFITALLSR